MSPKFVKLLFSFIAIFLLLSCSEYKEPDCDCEIEINRDVNPAAFCFPINDLPLEWDLNDCCFGFDHFYLELYKGGRIIDTLNTLSPYYNLPLDSLPHGSFRLSIFAYDDQNCRIGRYDYNFQVVEQLILDRPFDRSDITAPSVSLKWQRESDCRPPFYIPVIKSDDDTVYIDTISTSADSIYIDKFLPEGYYHWHIDVLSGGHHFACESEKGFYFTSELSLIAPDNDDWLAELFFEWRKFPDTERYKIHLWSESDFDIEEETVNNYIDLDYELEPDIYRWNITAYNSDTTFVSETRRFAWNNLFLGRVR